jgi:Cys-tRNA(Pro)/Cys-tRNA(Cys) deacylase
MDTVLQQFLQNERADFEFLNDRFEFKSAADGAKHYNITLAETTPTLILKAHNRFIAAIVCGNSRVVFEKLQNLFGLTLKMAKPSEVLAIAKAPIGQVCLVNRELETIIGNDYCYGGSGTSQLTLKLKTADLLRVTKAKVLDFTREL